MNMLVNPAYEELVKIIPMASICIDNLNDNKERWEELKEDFKEKMESGQNYIPESRGIIKEPKDTMLSSINPRSHRKMDPWDNSRVMYDTGIITSVHVDKH